MKYLLADIAALIRVRASAESAQMLLLIVVFVQYNRTSARCAAILGDDVSRRGILVLAGNGRVITTKFDKCVGIAFFADLHLFHSVRNANIILASAFALFGNAIVFGLFDAFAVLAAIGTGGFGHFPFILRTCQDISKTIANLFALIAMVIESLVLVEALAFETSELTERSRFLPGLVCTGQNFIFVTTSFFTI